MLTRRIVSGFSAGLLVSIGGCVFFSFDSRDVGAILFSVALLSICYKGYALFTGRVGYLAEDHSRQAVSALLLGLLGNTLGTLAAGFCVQGLMKKLSDTANTLCLAKLDQSTPETLFRAVLCGVLMYLAVSIYKEKQTIAGVVFCVPVFILSGFEHSIANLFYFAASGIVSLRAFGYLWIVIAGNALGGLLLPLLDRLGGKKEVPHG